ncbi:MAG: hypothetical protein OXI87_12240 [Albidovulum sp.]|nr:hypothetical protein [Albidovulum sp.]MDE0533649.1 hypothetical protein [Albidovulum sp.]
MDGVLPFGRLRHRIQSGSEANDDSIGSAAKLPRLRAREIFHGKRPARAIPVRTRKADRGLATQDIDLENADSSFLFGSIGLTQQV